MSDTYREYVGGGYYVTHQYCEHGDCNTYLGVNYPSLYCTDHSGG